MEALRAIRLDDAARRRRLMGAAGAGVAVGVGLIVAGELADWGWTRILGAGLITLGASVLGVLIGLAEPRRQQLLARLAAVRLTVAIILALVLVLPTALALAGSIVGAIAAGDQNLPLLLVGTVIGLLLLAATVASTVIAIRAVGGTAAEAAARGRREPTGEEGA